MSKYKLLIYFTHVALSDKVIKAYSSRRFPIIVFILAYRFKNLCVVSIRELEEIK